MIGGGGMGLPQTARLGLMAPTSTGSADPGGECGRFASDCISPVQPRSQMSAPLVQSVARASTLLRVLAAEGGYLPLGVIAAAAQLPKSTAHGLLQTLVSEDLVEHDSDRGRYRLSTNLTLTDRRRGSL